MTLDEKLCYRCGAVPSVVYAPEGPVCAEHSGYDGRKLGAVFLGARCPHVKGSARYHAWWAEYFAGLDVPTPQPTE